MHRHLYLLFGVTELILLSGLSAIGEKEHGIWHVCFFYSFGVIALLFFISNTVCHSQSLYFLNPYGRISYHVKIAISICYFLSAPAIATFYALYWKACFTWGMNQYLKLRINEISAYELFALVEYLDVFMVIFYHGCCVYWDIQHKVVFSVRLNKPEEKRIEKIDREVVSEL
uniref:CWH43-like N-terminal domain-containing protein n=1 Tax=Caenorhabditis tropicalis TaxID=1561998 RepID=A0A1I7TDV6_9PELO